MKTILNFFVICLTILLFSAESYAVNPYLLSQTADYFWSNNAWIIGNNTVTYSYKTDSLTGRIEEWIFHYGNFGSMKLHYQYDANGSISGFSNVSARSGKLVDSISTIYGKGKPITSLYFSFDSTGLSELVDSTVWIYQGNSIEMKEIRKQNDKWTVGFITVKILNSKNQDSIVMNFWDSLNTPHNITRYLEMYDSVGNRIAEYSQNPVFSGNNITNWVNSGRISYVYNTKRQLLESFVESKVDTIWCKNGDHHIFSYNDHDSLAEEIIQHLGFNSFENYSKTIYEYTEITDVPMEKSSGFQSILSPNPVSDVLNIQLPSGSFGLAQVKIFSQNGEEVLARNVEIESGSNSFRLDDLSSLSSGVYLVSVNINGTFLRQKFLKM